MKIAVIYSGIPRFVEYSSQSFKNNLFEGNDVDVFSYVWKTDEYKEIDNFYSHKVLQYQEPIDFFAKYPITRLNAYSPWYSLQHSCRSFQLYVESNNLEYDFIVRTRHDITLCHKIDFQSLNTSDLHVAEGHWIGHGREIFDDNLMILSQENYFKVFSTIFDWYENRSSTHQYLDIPEKKLTEYLIYKNMLNNINRTSNLDFFLTRRLFE